MKKPRLFARDGVLEKPTNRMIPDHPLSTRGAAIVLLDETRPFTVQVVFLMPQLDRLPARMGEMIAVGI